MPRNGFFKKIPCTQLSPADSYRLYQPAPKDPQGLPWRVLWTIPLNDMRAGLCCPDRDTHNFAQWQILHSGVEEWRKVRGEKVHRIFSASRKSSIKIRNEKQNTTDSDMNNRIFFS